MPSIPRWSGVIDTMRGIRDIVAVVVAADSPVGRAAQAIDDITAHLSVPDEPNTCPLCSTQSWPCAQFTAAAHRAQAAGLRLGELVPLDLHPYLWPTPQPPPRSAPPTDPTPRSDTWFDEESR